MSERFVQAALPVPFRRCCDYLPAADGAALPAPGSRVCVPFGGRREQVGAALRRCRPRTGGSLGTAFLRR